MKLRTLKDLEFGRTEKEDRQFIKQEAIKWVKEDIRDYENLFRDVLNGKNINSYTMNLIKKWMKRLNIKEEDLK